MNRIASHLPPACSHPRLRVVDYDERYRWVVACEECGETRAMSQVEYRRLLVDDPAAHTDLLVTVEGADSTRLPHLG